MNRQTLLFVGENGTAKPVFSAVVREQLPEVDVIHVSSASNCVPVVEARQPDVVLFEGEASGDEGLEACRRMTDDPKNALIRIIRMEPEASDARERARWFDSGAHQSLPSSIDGVEFIARIRAALRLKRTGDQMRDAAVSQKSRAEEKEAQLKTLTETAARELRESEERYRVLLENVNVGISLSTLDGKLVLANQEILRMAGYDDPREFLEVSALKRYANSADRTRLVSMLREKGVVRNFEIRSRRRDGSEYWISYNAVLLSGSGEKPALILSSIQDITERKRAEEALRESEERLRAIIQNEPECVKLLDREGRILEMNPAGLDMIEATLEQVRGKAARGIVVEEDRTAFDDLVAGVFRGERRSLVFGVTGLKGGRRTLETLSVPLRGPGGEGEVTALLSVTRDITERKAMEERLRQTEKMEAIGLLAGGVAHDFNNMLLAILGNAELMVSRAKDPEIRSYAEAVVSSAQRSTSLTRKLLAFARRGKYQVVPVDVHSVINDVIDLLGHSIDKRITVERRLEASCPVVQGDPPQVHNALLNLALNACDAMPNGGTLTFTTGTFEKGDCLPMSVQSEITTPGRLVRIDVQDTGTGFTEDARSHLFEPFFTTKPPGEGTGLGLASVYGTVKTHGGALCVESAPGLGTAFSLFLPAAPQIESPETEPLPDVSVPTRETTRILVIEDEALLRRLLQAMLHTIGYEAVLAADGSEGVENYRREWKSIDLVLLDVIMPVMGGYDTLVELKKVNPGVKAIVTSGYALDDDVRRILDLGAVGFVQKPFRMPDLLAEISKALGPESHCL